MWPSAPHHRTAYNEFVLWIEKLHLPQAGWVVDVGANHGDFSQAASSLYPKSRALLVEPLPGLRRELEMRCRHNAPRWRLAACALGSRPGTAKFYSSSTRDTSGSLVGISGEYLNATALDTPQQTFDCSVRTLDDLCAEHDIGEIDILKIDVEGFEFETLAGASVMLPKTKGLLLEISLVRRGAEDNLGVAEMLSKLAKAGFHLLELQPSLFAASEQWRPVEFNLLARRS
jgi:FkbM family methyltransferase